MKVALTGASGFLGAPCLKILSEKGHKVLALSRSLEKQKLLPGVVWFCADLNVPESYRGAVSGFQPEAVLHLAWEGIPDFSLQNSLRNLESGALFAGFALEQGCRHLVVSGSCWEYGGGRGALRETMPPIQPGVFGAAKNAQHLVIRSLLEAAGTSMAWARVFFPYGAGQKPASLVPTICRALLAGETPRLRTPEARSDFLFLEDAAAALVLLLESGADGVFNVGSGESTSAGVVADTLLRAAGLPPVFASAAPDLENGFFADTAAIRALGWRTLVSLDEGLSRTWDWYKEGYQS